MLRRLVAVLVAVAVPRAQDVIPAPGHTLDVGPVWSAHPVGFCLWTQGDVQLVGYYDAERRMTIAQRALDASEWTRQQLPSRLGWDSHNAVTMAVDRRGLVHVVGNLHAQALVYFRTREPLDVTTFERVPAMVGEREDRMTYPVFLSAPDGRLVFRYRDGGSGDGDDLLNVWDEERHTWSRLVEPSLLSGEGEVNGYFSAPTLGPDGLYHIAGIWRDTPDCATNHDVSYARSADLIEWEKADGSPLALPMTPGRIDIVDPVPARGGAINGNVRLGFDRAARPIVSYHKYDADGRTQVFCARFEAGAWVTRPVGSFDDYRWDFGGGGSIGFEVRIGAVRPAGDAQLALDYSFPGGSGSWLLDDESLEVLGAAPRLASPIPPALQAVESEFPGMQVRSAADAGPARADGRGFLLVWETLPPNRDRPREGALPDASMLRVVATQR